MDQGYTFTTTVPDDLAGAEQRVREALQEEGFGVLTEIDVEATLREKLGEEVGGYKILGACNPPLAHKAISADADVGALLPCNVVLRAADGGTDVVFADPIAMLQMSQTPALAELGAEAKARLERVAASLSP